MQKDVIDGSAELLIGTCLIYGSASSLDFRLWEIRALYAFVRNSNIAEQRYVSEAEVDQSVDRCDSGSLRNEWLQAHSQRTVP